MKPQIDYDNEFYDMTADLFDNAPILDIELPDFDIALNNAVLDKNDEEAFSALTMHLERAREYGDLNRLYEMSMVIGATACLHDHMKDFANSFDLMSKDTESKHNHKDGHKHEDDDEDDDEYEIDPKTGKKIKKKKRINWFGVYL